MLAACNKDDSTTQPTPSKEREDISLTKVEQTIMGLNNSFALNLLQKVGADDAGNILLSPLSASLALGMLNNGAVGATQQEIQEVLGYGDITRDELNAYYHKLVSALKNLDPKVTVGIANSIWIKYGFGYKLDFTETNANYYDAVLDIVDFTAPKTASIINEWCSDKTVGKIPEIVKANEIEAVQMLLLNALYFKGTWTTAFDPKNTCEEPFYNQDSKATSVKTMRNSELSARYIAVAGKYCIAELPYGNEAFNMTIVLPEEGVSLDAAMASLTADGLHTQLNTYIGHSIIDVKLPRFEVNYECTLNDCLRAMGMRQMFTDAADFSGITTDEPLCVGFVKQKTWCLTDEEGTEAAAVTAIGMVTTAMPTAPIQFYVNRPFLFFITEKSTEAILFAGKISSL